MKRPTKIFQAVRDYQPIAVGIEKRNCQAGCDVTPNGFTKEVHISSSELRSLPTVTKRKLIELCGHYKDASKTALSL